jgi:DNA invertase Pin-like site-specific DNA recombinase
MGQTTINQRRELEAVAGHHGWKEVQVFSDNGVSGAKGRRDRPGLDVQLKGVARRESTWWQPGRSIALGGPCRT